MDSDASDCEGSDHVVILFDDEACPFDLGDSVLDIFCGTSHKLLDHLGPEPLEDWTGKDYEKLQKKVPSKSASLTRRWSLASTISMLVKRTMQDLANPISNKVKKKECDILVKKSKKFLQRQLQVVHH